MATLTEVYPCFFLSCKASARVKSAKTGHGAHSFYLLCCMYCLFFVVFYIVCLYMCTLLLPPGGYTIAVKYIIYIYIYIIFIITLHAFSCVLWIYFGYSILLGYFYLLTSNKAFVWGRKEVKNLSEPNLYVKW
jgi:hypothetical protein